MLNAFSVRLLLAALVGWLDQRQQDTVAYLIEENRILRGYVRGRIRLTDDERRRLAARGYRLGRGRLRQVATRNHQGLENALIDDRTRQPMGTRIRRRPRLGGLLNYYERAA